MLDRRLQPRRRREVRLTRVNERMPHMNSKPAFLVRGGIGDIRRYYEHRNVAFCQRCLAGCDRFAAGLLWRHNHLDHSFTHSETSRY
jgi:hypothetical protein